ncbi:MAG: chromosome segregation protein SMC, partial [Anaerovoracaceae bacterium]
MYFKRIEMQGFKSFADPVVIEFDKGLTCVVGPNGSGKSNISDAIRWVLGEQSAKTLRGGKMEDVIFAGTASRRSRGMAEVTLVIDNSTKILPIDFNEVAVTRRMYRSGESEYAINNNQCRMRDVRNLFMDTGIGVDGYSLIGQGRISEIISNKSESIREIFEETAGIVSYRTKKAESQRKLTSATTNMERVTDIVLEIESRIDNLKDDSEKAQEFIKLRDRYKELEINITLKNIENITSKNGDIELDLSETTKALEEKKEEKVALDLKYEDKIRRNQNLEELGEEKRKELLELIEDLNSLINRGEVEKERLSSIEANTARLKEEIKEGEEKLNREKANSEEHFLTKNNIDKEAAELNRILEEKVNSFTDISTRQSDFATKVDSSRSSIFNLHTQKSTKSVELSSIESLKESLERRKKQVLSSKEEGNSNNTLKAEELTSLKKEMTDLSTTASAARAELDSLKSKLEADTLLEREKARKVEDLKINKSQLSSRKRTMEELDSNYEGFGHAVKFVMQSDSRGVHGVVADLMDVPQGFEVAIETALGGTIQNIVCDSDTVAKAHIERLKAHKAGRATFLPLETIRPRPVRTDFNLEKAVGFKGYAVECIKFDKKYEPVMEYLLGNAVIFDNMNNAIYASRNSAKGFIFVTQEGEVINQSGAITGGRHKNRSANILERKTEITKLEEELKRIEKELTLEEKARDEAADRIEKAKAKIQIDDVKVRDFEMKALSKESEINVLGLALSDLDNATAEWDRELKNIENEFEKSNLETVKLQKEIEETEKEIERQQTELENATEAHNNIREVVEASNEEITKARVAVSECQGKKDKSDAIVAMLKEAIED